MPVNINAQSALDSFMPNPNGRIRAAVVQPDGKIIIGGDFTSVQGMSRKRLARLNIDGTLDNSFAPNPDDHVFALALQPDGKIIAGGRFTSVSPNGGAFLPRNYIARFNADGTLDTTFDPNANDVVNSIVVQPNGKIIAGGRFTSVAPNGGATVARNHIARFETDGTLDTTFDSNADDEIYSMAIQTDGRIIIVGNFVSVAPNGGTIYIRHHVARLNADGTLDTTFDLGVDQSAFTVAVQSDGKFIVGGYFNNILTNGSPTATRNRIARFNADGTLDTTFDPNTNNAVLSIAVQPDGKILAGGNFTTIAPNGGATVTRNNVARINLDGTLDAAFNPNTNGQVFSLAVQSDGKIFIGGVFNSVGGAPRNNFMRLEKGGLPDFMLTQNTNNVVYTTALQTDGKILVGGDFTTINGTTRNRLARLNADSQLDTLFNPNVNGAIYAIHVQTDGKILIGGDFTNIGGSVRNRIARLNANGSLDYSFNSSANNSVRAFAVQPDGKILVGGAFTNISGQARNYFARLNADGFLDNTFYNPNVNNQIHTITLQPNGKILIGGDFTTVTGAARTGIARLLANGIVDNTFTQTANGGVTAFALQTDGKILIGGNFTNIGFIPRTRIARLNTDGSVDGSFSASLNAAPASVAVQSDGLILLGGQFYTINGYMTYHIARLNADGSLDPNFYVPVNAPVRSLTLQPDGKILVGGQFTNIANQSRNYFARLTNTAAALSALDVYSTTLILTRDGAATQFSRVIFEQSIDNGANWTTLGTAANSLTSTVINDKNDASVNPFAPVSTGYILTGQNIPTGQNVLIRARGFYRAGEKNGSEIVEDKVQNVFLPAPTANVSVSGQVVTSDGAGLRNALVQLTFGNGESVTKRTSAFGYFQFDEIAAGQTVTISVTAKNYSFSPQIVNVNDNVAGLIFTSN